MQTDVLRDEIATLARQVTDLRQRIGTDADRPGTLAEAGRSLFRAQGGPERVIRVPPTGRITPDVHMEFMIGGGTEVSYWHPLKPSPANSPPEFERQLHLRVDSIGESPWLTLRLPLGDEEFERASLLWWELAGAASPAFDICAFLRVYRADGGYDDHPVGHGGLFHDRVVISAELDLEADLKAPAKGADPPALYFFIDPRDGQELTLDYLIAHVT